MRHDLLCSSHDHERSTSKFDLRSGYGNDLSRSCCISVHASRQGKQIGDLPHVSISFLSKVMDRKLTLLWHLVTSSGQNTFLPITFDRKEIKTWGGSQFVCLDETHRLISDMQHDLLRSFPWSDMRSNFEVELLRSRDDQNRSCRICVDASWWDRLSYTIPTS